MATRRVVQRISFRPGSKPYMLRVAPDGKTVWVQTAVENTNVVLDVETMAVLQTTPMAKGPITNAFQPGGGPYGLVMHGNDTVVAVLDRQGREVKRVDVGKPQATAAFTPDGATAFVTVVGGDEVVAIDMAQLAVVARIPTGRQPNGIVLLDAASGPPGLPNTGAGGGPGRPAGAGGWLLTVGGLAVLAGLRLRRRAGRLEQADYRRLDQHPN